LASASVSSKAIIAILSKTRPIARMVLLPVRLFVRPMQKARRRRRRGKPLPSLAKMHPDLSKRGFLSFVFDGRYNFARYYAPAAFNTPQTLDQIFKYNDVQLFDLSEDPDELHNLALERDKYKDTILRMNALLNDLMAKEVGKNDGAFLPAAVRPKQTVVFDKQ